MSERLRGVILERVDRKHLAKIVKNLKLTSDTSVESLVGSLADHLIKLHKTDPAKLLECDFCKGSSDETFDICPYCAMTDEAATKAAAAAPAPEEKPLVNARAGKAEKPAKEKPAKDKPAKEKPAKAGKLAVVPPSDVEVAHTAEIVSTKELDDVVAEIKRIQIGIVDQHWLLGQKLSESYEKNLYKLRLTSEGQPAYKNWGAWVMAELAISPRYAYDLAAVSKVFSQADIAEVGVTKLRPLVRIPEEAKRANLLAKAKEEVNGKPAMSRRELEQEVKGLPARKGLGGGAVGGEKAEGKRAAKTKGREVERAIKTIEDAKASAKQHGVTVAIVPERVTLPLFAGAKSKKSTIARAQDIADEPQAVEDLLNGVKVRYHIVKEADGLVLVIDRIRE